MPASPESFAKDLEKLIAKFEGDKTHYLSRDYSEAQARIDFVTALFKALGCLPPAEFERGLLAQTPKEAVARQLSL